MDKAVILAQPKDLNIHRQMDPDRIPCVTVVA